MDTATFWHMIETAKAESKGNCEQQAQLLQQHLTLLPPEEISSFDRLLWVFWDEAYSRQLWAAAYLMNGAFSDEGFDSFRGWLIAQGEAGFRAALQGPDTLADAIEPLEAPQVGPLGPYGCEEMLYVAWPAFEAKADQEMPQDDQPSSDLVGEAWEEDADAEEENPWADGDLSEQYARKHLPKLWAKFGWGDL